jgi:RNA polymerase sigma-70 factor (ECF subfamily)
MLDATQSFARVNQPLAICASGLGDIDELIRTYKSYIMRFALVKLRDRDLAESVTQDCFLRAFYSQSLYRGECSVRTWLTTIAINLIHDITRSKRRQFWQEAARSAIDVGDIHDRTPSHHLSPEAHLLLREQLAGIWDTVDGLSKPQREVFLMRFACEMKVAEIADITGMNLSTVKSNLHRGLEAVRSQPRRTARPRPPENKVATLQAAKPNRRNWRARIIQAAGSKSEDIVREKEKAS